MDMLSKYSPPWYWTQVLWLRISADVRLRVEPGGYLQWSEYDLANTKVDPISPRTITRKMQYLVDYPRNSVPCG